MFVGGASFSSGGFLEALLEPWRSFKEFGGHLEFGGAQRLDWCSLEVLLEILFVSNSQC